MSTALKMDATSRAVESAPTGHAGAKVLPAVAFVWEQFGVYHLDRLEALANAFQGKRRVVGIEFASRSLTYAWAPTKGAAGGWERHTLFPDGVAESIPWWRKATALRRILSMSGVQDVFLCNQERPEILAVLPLLRAQGYRCYAMLDAKFDDSPRRVSKEFAKRAVFRLYNGGLLAGPPDGAEAASNRSRHLDYYRFLGMHARWARPGYDVVSIARVREHAGGDAALPPEGGASHADRPFVCVARFVPKKDLATAVRALALLRRNAAPGSLAARRRLVLCGAGPLKNELRALVQSEGIADAVSFPGFLDAEAVARTLGSALALVLPSVEEQWGLVVNEAVALGVPVLCSDNVGARDSLVRTGVNGFSFEPGNHEGLSLLMRLVSEDEVLWRGLSRSCARFAPLGDVAAFVAGVDALLPIAPAHDKGRLK